MTHKRTPSTQFLAATPLLFLALSACGHNLSAAAVSESFGQTVSLSANGSVELSNVNGSIEVTGWDRDEVHIDAVKKASTIAKLEEIEIEVDATADRVSIETDLPRNGNASVSYRISAPQGARLDVDTVNGSVRVAGVRGDVEAQSVNGSIDADGLAASTSIKTVNGSVAAHYAAAPDAGEHHFKSVNGAIAVYLPAAPSGRFAAKSVNGSIHNDFGLEVRKARYGPMRSMEGSLGSGAGEFEFDTVNGSIKILSSRHSAATR
jgi:DUF4097 and DUF4098 domain-containing protein YvlB